MQSSSRIGLLTLTLTLPLSWNAPSAAQEAAEPPPEGPSTATPPPPPLPAEAPVAPVAPVQIEKSEVPLPVAPPAVDEKVAEDPRADRKWTDIVTLSGYAEAYYHFNFARPENRVTNNRWLDERHNSFTLQTLALDLAAEYGPVSAKVTVMFGPTADRWYFEGAQIAASPEDAVLSPSGYSNETWKHIQTAYAAYRAPIGEGLLIQGGLMPTQVGYEGAAVKDNGNWSRSNLFNFLPFFHVGLRVSYPLAESLTLTGAVYNGWNQASDLNRGKTVSLQSAFANDDWVFNLLYLGGNERPTEDPTGKPWRNLFDAVVQYTVSESLTLALNADAGFEKGDLGTDAWAAAALYARVRATPWLYFAVRGDGIYEKVATRSSESGEQSAAIFFGGGDHVLSGTVTGEIRPIDGVSFRLEYRHDDSDPKAPMFYKRGFDLVDGTASQRTSRAQNTVTLGMTGWF